MTTSQILNYYKTRSSIRAVFIRCAKYVSQFESAQTLKSKDALNHLFACCSASRGHIAKMLENFTRCDDIDHSVPNGLWPAGLYYLFPIGYEFEKISLPADSPEEFELKLAALGF